MSKIIFSSICTGDSPGAGDQNHLVLFQVWIDLNCGDGDPWWWWNSPPKPLTDALEEAASVRADEWICKLMPEGMNPRPDGRWDNPPNECLTDLLKRTQ